MTFVLKINVTPQKTRQMSQSGSAATPSNGKIELIYVCCTHVMSMGNHCQIAWVGQCICGGGYGRIIASALGHRWMSCGKKMVGQCRVSEIVRPYVMGTDLLLWVMQVVNDHE